MTRWRVPRIGREGAKFAAVGGVATGTHVAVAGIAIYLIPGLNEYVANLAGFTAALWVSYYGHSHITFGQSGSPLRLVVVSGGGFMGNNVILAALTETGVLTGYPAIVVAVTVVPAGVFLASKYWVFTGKRKARGRDGAASPDE